MRFEAVRRSTAAGRSTSIVNLSRADPGEQQLFLER
jgi:hypothetical protein